MTTTFERMDGCLRIAAEGAPDAVPKLAALLDDDDWRVRYVAAVALGDLADPGGVPALVETLRRENAAPLYTQKEDLGGGAAGSPGATRRAEALARTPPATLEAWRRRGRLKQAACLALGRIGPAAAPSLPFLRAYAVDQEGEDYAVRAAACHALGRIDPDGSRDVLARAARDEEFCTRTEALKALGRAGP